MLPNHIEGTWGVYASLWQWELLLRHYEWIWTPFMTYGLHLPSLIQDKETHTDWAFSGIEQSSAFLPETLSLRKPTHDRIRIRTIKMLFLRRVGTAPKTLLPPLCIQAWLHRQLHILTIIHVYLPFLFTFTKKRAARPLKPLIESPHGKWAIQTSERQPVGCLAWLIVNRSSAVHWQAWATKSWWLLAMDVKKV